MKKRLLLLFAVLLLSSCGNKIQKENLENPTSNTYQESEIKKDMNILYLEDLEKENKEELTDLLLYQVKKNYNTHTEPYSTYRADYVANFNEGNRVSLLARIDIDGYNYADGIFELGYGIRVPAAFIYERDSSLDRSGKTAYRFKEIVEAEDGELSYESIKKMAHNDQEIIDKLINSKATFSEDHRRSMDLLKEDADKKKLQNYSHTAESVPNYDKDIVYLKENNRHVEDTIVIVKTKDYDTITEENAKGEDNIYPGLLFDRKTGIAVRHYVFPPVTLIDNQ